ncbi:MAG: hypothetical protein AAB557_04300 [Patescibacteria group bacterium]
MELIIVLAISIGIAILNSFHVILQWTLNKPGETFTGIAHSFADYFLYTGQMAQGAAGRWVWSNQLFTNEPTSSTWYYWFNVTLGHLGSWVGLSPFATYNISLFLFVIVLCLAWYLLSKLLYPTNMLLRLTTWLLILTSTNFISFARPGLAKLSFLNFSQGELLGQFWFSPAPVFNRLGGVPYQVVQSILFILLAMIVSQFLSIQSSDRIRNPSFTGVSAGRQKSGITKKINLFYSLIHHSIFLILLAFFAGSANPVQMLLLVIAAGGTTVISNRWNFLPLGILLLAGGFGAWMTNQEFAQQDVFVAARAWELAQYTSNSLPNILLSIGPVLLFIPFGIRNVFKEKNPLHILFITWGVISFVLFLSPIPRFLELSPVRMLHPVPYAAAIAILGVDGLVQLSVFLHHRLKNKYSINSIRAILIVMYLLLTVPPLAKQFTDRITPARNPQLLMDTVYNHVPTPIVEALTWIKNDDSIKLAAGITGLNPVMERQVVLVDPTIPIEILVPVFTEKISFSGHPIHTLYPDVKEARRQEFFGGKMNKKDAAQFLKDHRIGYIITTPSRRLSISLQKVFSNTTVSIYK